MEMLALSKHFKASITIWEHAVCCCCLMLQHMQKHQKVPGESGEMWTIHKTASMLIR